MLTDDVLVSDRFDGGIDLYEIDEDDPWIVDDAHGTP